MLAWVVSLRSSRIASHLPLYALGEHQLSGASRMRQWCTAPGRPAAHRGLMFFGCFLGFFRSFLSFFALFSGAF